MLFNSTITDNTQQGQPRYLYVTVFTCNCKLFSTVLLYFKWDAVDSFHKLIPLFKTTIRPTNCFKCNEDKFSF